MPARRLNAGEVEQAVRSLPGWTLNDNAIQKQFTFPGFLDSIAFVNRVAELAEAANHHPDITITYDRVRLDLTTHDSGGVTENDVNLASKIESIAQP